MITMRTAPVFSAAVLLAGCLTSRQQLITAENADYPIADGTKFHRTTPGNPDDFPADVVLRRAGANYVIDSDGEDIVGLMKEVGPNTFVAAATHEGRWLYNVYVKEGEAYLQYTLTCEEFEKLVQAKNRPLGDFGITRMEDDCEFANLDDLGKAALFAVEAGAQPGKRFDPVK